MKDSRLFTTIAILIVLWYTKADAQDTGYNSVYVSRSGNDSESCGSDSKPCRSIGRAVDQVDRGGLIFLDGTGTKDRPFHCEGGVIIDKSVTIESFNTKAYLFCVEGILSQNSKIALVGIAFQETPLVFNDCSHVRLDNCSHQRATTAISVTMKYSDSVQLDINGSSFYQNNSSCIKILLIDVLNESSIGRSQSLAVTLNITDTEFKDNGAHVEQSAAGLIIITSNSIQPSTASDAKIHISCNKVTCVNNTGPFVNLDVPSAATSEIYKDVKLLNNSAHPTSNVSRNSLFTSRARRTYAKFLGLHCEKNVLLRCIKIESDEAEVSITRGSSFREQRLEDDRGAAVYLQAKEGANLTVLNSKFELNSATSGGAMYVTTKHGMLRLNITDVEFTSCVATIGGCALVVGEAETFDRSQAGQTAMYDLFANFRKVRVENCVSPARNECASVCISLGNGKVSFEDSMWLNNPEAKSGVLVVGSTGSDTDVSISGCQFINNNNLNSNSNNDQNDWVVRIWGEHAGSATVADTVISQSAQGAIKIDASYNTKLINVSITSFKYGLEVSNQWNSRVFPAVSISIERCNFLGNVNDVLFNFSDPRSVHLNITDTNFIGNRTTKESSGICCTIWHLNNISSSEAVVVLDRVTFESRPCNAFALYFQGKKAITIRRSIFRNCICTHPFKWQLPNTAPRMNLFHEAATGAIAILSDPDQLVKSGCLNSKKETHPMWSYDSHILFEDTLFDSNAGGMAGAVYITNGNTTFQNCTFRNNFAIIPTGQVYAADGSGQVELNNCSFLRTQMNLKRNGTDFTISTFFSSKSEGPVKFRNTSMFSAAVAPDDFFPAVEIIDGGYADIDQNSNIQCSGSPLLFENASHFVYKENSSRTACWFNATVLRYGCGLCHPGFYSLQNGTARGMKVVQDKFKCMPCPFGATCIRNKIAAKPNFWGYQMERDPPSLAFVSCPESYCETPNFHSWHYNRCHGNRAGILCGACAPGFTETLFTTECRRSKECGNYLLWILVILYTTGLPLYLLIKPPLMPFLRKQILWFRRDEAREDLGYVAEHTEFGFLKITFYYYQAAELLIVGSLEELLHNFPFLYSIVSAFNFQVRTINGELGCPFAGLTVVTKELFLSLIVFFAMSNVVILYFVHLMINLSRKKACPSLIHYMAIFMEILLLGYERLAETSLKLMHCVSLGSDNRLFYDGNIQCWQWWQFVLLGYIAGFVVPFIAVLYFGSSKLHKKSISASAFLAACMFPVFFLVYWFLRYIFTRNSHESEGTRGNSKEVLKVLHDPFRPPNEKDQGTLYWESVLIGRRFILLTFYAFIANSMLRMTCMTGACVLILAHHLSKNPYRQPLANKVEALSLITLAIIAIINMTKATLFSSGIFPGGPNKLYLEGMQWFEVCALAAFPALLFVSTVFAMLSQLVRLAMVLMKKFFVCVRYLFNQDELTRPLLDVTER